MKTKIIIIIIFSIISSFGYAQLNYEGIVDSKYKSVQLEDGQFKYLNYNKKSQELKIYNLDNTLWKTVKLPLPKHHVLDEIKYISQSTFNKDELIEVVYSCVVYSNNSDYEDPFEPFVNISFTLNIINERGESILKVEDSNDMEIIDSEGQKKLLIYKHIGKDFNAHSQTIIYSLPN
ncbi:MAG: hypothetical protein PF485_04420 [Bacteroidales bacterium]|jgi:hypothetical protein|nr:hypothetical protein [Bacteroidales bacterium]